MRCYAGEKIRVEIQEPHIHLMATGVGQGTTTSDSGGRHGMARGSQLAGRVVLSTPQPQ